MAHSQTISGSIVGTVTDASGALIPDADVTATNQATNSVSQYKTNGSGEYTIANVLPGLYSVKVIKTGFVAQELKDVDVEANRSMRADLTLRTGGNEQIISVAAREATLNTEDATIGNVIQGQIIPTLPVNGRTVDKLLRLSAGVTSDNTSSGTNPRIGGSAYYGGVQFNVDGLAYNDALNGGGLYSSQGLNTQPPIDAIGEFKVDSSNTKAEYAGTVSVTTVTKSGSNQFHGAAYEFNRNKALAAIGTFVATAAKPKFNRNEYGAVVTGPIFRNHLFFMGYFEGYSERSSRTISDSVAPQTLRNGDFSNAAFTTPGTTNTAILLDPLTGLPFPNNMIPAARISAATKAILAFSPLPNNVGTGPGGTINNLIENVPNAFNVRRYGGKLDYTLNSKNTFAASLFHSGSGQYIQALGYPPTYGNFSNAGFQTDSASLSWIHLFSDHLVNEARIGFLDQRAIRLGQNITFDPSSIIPGLYTPLPYGGIPEVRPTGSTNIGDYGGAIGNQHTYQIVDNVTYSKGSHTIKAGIDLVKDYVTRPPNALGASFLTGTGNYAFGRFDFDGRYTKGGTGANATQAFADFLLGYPEATYRSTPAVRAGLTDPHYDFFAQDDWRIRPNLTLTFGFRYQLQQPWSTDGAFANFDPSLDKLVVQGNTFPASAQARLVAAYPIVTSSAAGYGDSFFKRDNGDYSPRVGFAYRPFNNDKVSVRGGAGIYYNLFPSVAGPYQMAQTNPPFFLSETFGAAAGYSPSLTLATPFPGNGALSANPNVFGVARQLRNGREYQWNASVDNALTKNLGLRVSYVGNRTNHLMYNGENINLPNVQKAVALQTELPFQPWSTVSFTSFGGDSYFNQLQVEGIMRARGGLNFQAEYGWTKSIDDVPISGGPQNPFNPRADRGNSDAIHPQVFSFGATYDLPFGLGKRFLSRGGVVNEIIGGWQIATITVLENGAPFSVSFSASGTGAISSRADVVPGVDPRSIQNRGRHLWFNTAAFKVPAVLTYGNSPRNYVFAPGSEQFDASVLKNFKIREGTSFQFRAEAFNALNHVNLGTPAANISVPSTFGVITATGPLGTDNRVVQFAGKILF